MGGAAGGAGGGWRVERGRAHGGRGKVFGLDDVSGGLLYASRGSSLGTVRWTIGGKIMEETPSLGWWVDIDVVLDHVGKPVNPIRGSMPSYSLVTWDMLQRSTPGLFPMKPDDLIGFSRAGLSGER